MFFNKKFSESESYHHVLYVSYQLSGAYITTLFT